MKEHHQRAINRISQHFQSDPNFLAMIIGGSIRRGWEREDSDVDFLLIATDEEFERRHKENKLTFYSTDFSDYPGGYVDGKILNHQYLTEAAERANEATRSAFVNALVVYSRMPELEALIKRISAYPEADREKKMSSFYAQVQALQWFVGEAEKRGDPYLMAHASADLALFAGRMILAYNRVLYPYHKWFLTALREVNDKPEHFMEDIECLLAHPGKESADRLCSSIYEFTEWPAPAEGWPARFMRDAEWGWRTGQQGVEDW